MAKQRNGPVGTVKVEWQAEFALREPCRNARAHVRRSNVRMGKDMQQPTIITLTKDTRFEGFLLVRMSEQRTGSNGGKYLDMTLADRTGELNAKLWDGTVPARARERGEGARHHAGIQRPPAGAWNACAPRRRPMIWT